MINHDIQPSIVEHLLTLLSLSADPEIFEKQQENLYATLGAQYMDTAYQIKKFIDEIPGGFLIYRADEDEKIIYANKALMRIYKCDSFEEFAVLTRNSFKGMVHPADLDEVEQQGRPRLRRIPHNRQKRTRALGRRLRTLYPLR